ncbi:putative TPR repeat methyltransferase [Marivita geojedonensis]|nr:putative TPR repeat methyltransferase [Marivita geojedonensis]
MAEMQSDRTTEAAPVVLEIDEAEVARIVGRIEEARALIDAGDVDEAMELCESILKTPGLPVNAGIKVGLLVRDLGHTDIANSVFENSYAKLQLVMDRLEDPERALLPAAEALADLERYDEAEVLCRKAIDTAPDNLTVAVGYAAFLVHRDRLDDAMAITQRYCDLTDNKFNGAIHFAMIFDHLNCDDASRACLERAKKHCKTKTQRAKLDFFLASKGMKKTAEDQHGMAVELFDEFADDYDKQLTKLDNNGPSMVFTALEELNLPKTGTRRILDAGCGTGLCAGFLRPYAKELHGIDLSVKMLEISRQKGGYDYLARTDLSEIVTYPEGKFDMIVCADVLVYFGALNTVLRNLSSILTPGGWLLLTVEHENDPDVATGFKLYPSGRHKHTDAYMQKTLAEAGFPKPKMIKHARLRNELGAPILGTLIAVQKPALMFG